MNILLICRDFLHHGGSAARWNSMVNYLSKKHRIFVVATVSETPRKGFTNKHVYVLRGPLKPRLTNIPFASLINIALLFSYLFRFLSNNDVDVVIVTIPEIEEGIAGAIASRTFKKTLIFDVRDVIVDDYVESVFPRPIREVVGLALARILTWSLNLSNSVITVTSTLKRFLRIDGVEVPIHVIPNGAEKTLFHPAPISEKRKVREDMGFDDYRIVLYSGAMNVKYYPMEVIYRAFDVALASIPNARLVLCGSSRKGMEAELKKLEKNVQYLGVLQPEDLAKIMRASDIGVISMDERKSTFCALTTKFFEYLASGLPVVAACPKGGELDTVITSSQVGYAVRSGDFLSMADKIVDLLTYPKKIETWSKNGIDLVSKRFDRNRLAEQYERIISNIVKK